MSHYIMKNIQIEVYEKWLWLLLVVILSSSPSYEHFQWPLKHCLAADICNHSWIPECGLQNATDRNPKILKRLFLDVCDMHEYNCDQETDYVLTNYSLCFGSACGGGSSALRMGNYKLIDDERRMVYDPTDKYGNPEHTHPTTSLTFPTTVRPNLPAYMFNGRRRYTPRRPSAQPSHTPIVVVLTTKQTSTKTKRSTIIMKRISMMKNGRRLVKIVKGYGTPEPSPLRTGTTKKMKKIPLKLKPKKLGIKKIPTIQIFWNKK